MLDMLDRSVKLDMLALNLYALIMLALILYALIMLYVVILSRHGSTKSRGSCTRCEVRYFILMQRVVSHRRKHRR